MKLIGELIDRVLRADEDKEDAVKMAAFQGQPLTAEQASENVEAMRVAFEKAAADIKELAAQDAVQGQRFSLFGQDVFNTIEQSPKPVIAAVNGTAYAGGLEWACFADIRIADAHASFGVTCRRWNIGLADGGTQRLPRIVGMGRAMELIITGRVVDAEEALAALVDLIESGFGEGCVEV